MAGLRLGYRDVERLAELHDGFAGLGVAHAAARNEHRLLGGLDQFHRLIDFIVIRNAAGNVMYTLLEEVIREIETLALYVLRHGDDRGAAVCRIGQHAERIDHRAHQLLGTGYTIPVLGDRLEAVGSGHGQIARYLKLLEYRVRLAGCKGIGREQKQRDVVDGCGQRCGYHIGSAYADRGRAGDDLAAVVLLGVRDRSVRHALLVAALIDPQVTRVLLKRLSEADHHAVAEDGENAIHERLYLAVHFDVLSIEELNDCLTNSHSGFAHNASSLYSFVLRGRSRDPRFLMVLV